MESREIGSAGGDVKNHVDAAERLLQLGWWELEQEQHSHLQPLLSSGLRIHTNISYSKLGLNTFLIVGRTDGNLSLADLQSETSFGQRLYHSSALGEVLLAATPLPRGLYNAVWALKMREGHIQELTVTPLQEMHVLMAPIEAYNEESGRFDFIWQNLPKRSFRDDETSLTPVSFNPDTIIALNEISKNPARKLSEISASCGVSLEACRWATKFIRNYPLAWRCCGLESHKETGILLLFRGLTESMFGAVRGGVASVPFTTYEAFGRDNSGFVYLAELVVPGPSLTETMEHTGRIAVACRDSFSYGIYDSERFHEYSLPHRRAGPEGWVSH